MSNHVSIAHLPEETLRMICEALRGTDDDRVHPSRRDNMTMLKTAGVCRAWRDNPVFNAERGLVRVHLRQRLNLVCVQNHLENVSTLARVPGHAFLLSLQSYLRDPEAAKKRVIRNWSGANWTDFQQLSYNND